MEEERREEEKEKGRDRQAEIAFIYERPLAAQIIVHSGVSLKQITFSIQLTVEDAQIFVGCC